MDEITPILLAGGYGSRLWPVSRKSFPKQFSNFIIDKSLFQLTAIRFISSKNIKFSPHITISNSEYRFFVSQQLLSSGIDPGPIILEPESKNTAAAIITSTILSYEKNKDSIIVVSPSDHIIPNTNEFHKSLKIGLKEITKGRIVTFGIKPTHAETGFGYLELEKSSKKVIKLLRFIEKPTKKLAKKMISKDNFLWNSGIFLYRAQDMIKAFETFAPDILFSAKIALKNSKKDLGFLRLDSKAWSEIRSISIDFAIMENAKNLSVVPFLNDWSDLGNWEAVWQEMKPNNNGVSLSANSHAINCNNTLIRSDSPNQEVVGLGLKDIITIATPDAVLVANKKYVQDIKNIVEHLKSKKISQAEDSLISYRPWGFFESLSKSNFFQVKKIVVNPKAKLSLQSHNYRSEHWIIVEGQAKITIEERVTLIKEGESVFVPQKAKHRLENPNDFLLVLIEIQLGTYLGEDDIIRYEDIYFRK